MLVLTAEHLGESISTENKKQRCLLRMCLEQNWKCHWCPTIMRWGKRPDGGKLNRDQATIDHLNDRYDPKRATGEAQPKVAACQYCNQKRARDRGRSVSKELQKMPWRERRQILCQEATA
jgi:hypothetical protein